MNELIAEKALSEVYLAERLCESAHELINHATREGALMSPRELLDLARLAAVVQQINLNAISNIRLAAKTDKADLPDVEAYQRALEKALELI